MESDREEVEGSSPKRRRKNVAGRSIAFEAALPEIAPLSRQAWSVACAAGVQGFLATTKHLPKVHKAFCTEFISSFDSAASRGFVQAKAVVLTADAVQRATLLPLGIQAPDSQLSGLSTQQLQQLQVQLKQMPSERVDIVLKVAKAVSSLMNLRAAGTTCVEGVPCEVIVAVLASSDRMQWAAYLASQIAASVERVRSGADRIFSMGRWLTAVIHVCFDKSIPREEAFQVGESSQTWLLAAAATAASVEHQLAPIAAPEPVSPAVSGAMNAASAALEEHRFVLPDDLAAEDPSFTNLLRAHQDASKVKDKALACAYPKNAANEDSDDEMLAAAMSSVLSKKKQLQLKLSKLTQEMKQRDARHAQEKMGFQLKLKENEARHAEEKQDWLEESSEEKRNLRDTYNAEITEMKREIELSKAKLEETKAEAERLRSHAQASTRDAGLMMVKRENLTVEGPSNRIFHYVKNVKEKLKMALENAEQERTAREKAEALQQQERTAREKAEALQLQERTARKKAEALHQQERQKQERTAREKLEALQLQERTARALQQQERTTSEKAALQKQERVARVTAEALQEQERMARVKAEALQMQERENAKTLQQQGRTAREKAEALQQQERVAREKAEALYQNERLAREKAEANQEEEVRSLQEKVLQLEKENESLAAPVKNPQKTIQNISFKDLNLVRRRRWSDDVDDIVNWPIVCGDFTSEQACIQSYRNFSDLHKDSKDKVVADAASYCRKLAEWLSLEEESVPLILNVNRPMDDWEDVGLYRRIVFLNSSNLYEFEKMCRRQFLMGSSANFVHKKLDEDRRILAESYHGDRQNEKAKSRYQADNDWKTFYPALRRRSHNCLIDDEFVSRLKSRQLHGTPSFSDGPLCSGSSM